MSKSSRSTRCSGSTRRGCWNQPTNAAGAAARLGGSWWVVQRSHLLDATPPVVLVAVNRPARGRGPAPTATVMPPAPVVHRAPIAPPTRVIGERLAARMKPAPPPEVALPFDAVLGTILSSSDRKLAIVDNRIVWAGDQVRGAGAIEMIASAVMLRDEQGRLRRLALDSGGA